MSKERFEMSEDLLRSVILKQAGSVLKAIEECIQNALDADATIIELGINQLGFRFYDNGCGMNKNQIDSYFKIFGNSSKKNSKDKIGAFGMGRGQVFSFGYTVWQTKNWKISVNIMRRLGYKIRKIRKEIKGTEIYCTFFNMISGWECDSIESNIKKYFIPNDKVKFFINGEEYNPKMEIKTEYCNKEFTVFNSDVVSKSIFSQNLYVKQISSMFNYNINCNNKMPLNFARNAFLDNEEQTKSLNTLLNEIEKIELLKIKRYDSTGGKHILELLVEGKLDIKDFIDKKIVESCNGKLFSLKELENHKEIMFGYKDSMSDKAIQQGHIVINENISHLIRHLISKNKINLNISRYRPGDVVVMPKHEKVNEVLLFKEIGYRAVVYYFYIRKLNEEIFGTKRRIVLGKSDLSGAWTDGSTFIAINIKLFKKKMIRREKEMEIYQILLHEYAHEDDDTNETDHDGNFYERYYNLMNKTARKFGKFIQNVGIKEIEREYKHLIDEIINEIENNN